MSIFSNVKKYRKPLTDIDGKIRQLEERMTVAGFYNQLDDPGQPEIQGEPTDEYLGDLADLDNFEVPDQTGSSPDMSQLTATDANGNVTNLLSVPAGAENSGGVGVIRYGSFGAGGGAVYAVLQSNNREGSSWITGSVFENGGDPAVGDWVEANFNKWTAVQWHFYRNPGLADAAFTPIARNVGPGGNFTLWSCGLLVIKNPNFVNQKYIAPSFTRFGMGDPSYYGGPYLRYRGSGGGGGGRRIKGRLGGLSNAARGMGGFVGGFTGKNFRKFLRNAAKAGIPVGDINQATRIFMGHPPAPPKRDRPPQLDIPRQVSPVPPDLPGYDDAPVDMPQIEPDPKPTPTPTPLPTLPTPKPTPTPTPKPTPTPTPPRRSPGRGATYTPSPDDLTNIGAKTPPPPKGYGDRGKFFDDYYTGTFESTGNDYVDKAFSRTKIPTSGSETVQRSYKGLVIRLAEQLTKAEELLKSYRNMIPPSGDSFAARMARAHLERETSNRQAEVFELQRRIIQTQGEVNQLYLNAKNDFEQGGSVIDYVDTYKDSHPAETDKVVEKAVNDNFDKAQKEFSSNKEAILKELMKDPLFRVGKNLAEYSAPTTAKLFLDFLTGDLPPTIDNAYLGNDYVNKVLEKGILSDDAQFKMPFGDFIIATGQPITPDDYNPLTDEVSVRFNYNFQDTKTVMSGAQGTAMETFYNALSPIASAFSGGEKYKFDSLPVPLASKYIEKAEKLGGAKGRPGEVKLKLSDIKKSNPKFYNQLINKGVVDRARVVESYLQESIEFEQQTGVPVDHVANVMDGIADAVDVLGNCIDSLILTRNTWIRKSNNKRYEIPKGEEGSQEKPLEITFSDSTNEYLLTNQFTGEPYNPEQDGRLSDFLVKNATTHIDHGGNVAAKCVMDNFIQTPEVLIDDSENIVMLGKIYLFNSKQGIEYSIMTQVLSAITGITETLGFSIDGFSEEWNNLYQKDIEDAFSGLNDVDKEMPVLNVVMKIPFDQAHLYTKNSYLRSPENVKESMMSKWKRRTNPENRLYQGEYEFFLNALSSLPSVAKTYIQVELKMQLEQLLLPPNERLDPKMVKVQSMLNANQVYIDNTFVENEKLFKKVNKSIRKNIELTDPKSFKVTPPPMRHVDIDEPEIKHKSIKKYMKKYEKKRPNYLKKRVEETE